MQVIASMELNQCLYDNRDMYINAFVKSIRAVPRFGQSPFYIATENNNANIEAGNIHALFTRFSEHEYPDGTTKVFSHHDKIDIPGVLTNNMVKRQLAIILMHLLEPKRCRVVFWNQMIAIVYRPNEDVKSVEDILRKTTANPQRDYLRKRITQQFGHYSMKPVIKKTNKKTEDEKDSEINITFNGKDFGPDDLCVSFLLSIFAVEKMTQMPSSVVNELMRKNNIKWPFAPFCI